MKKVLKNNLKTQRYLNKLRKVYLIGHWYRYGVREYPFAGKFVQDEVLGLIPLVYHYDDRNGTVDNWYLVKLSSVTTGSIISYSFSNLNPFLNNQTPYFSPSFFFGINRNTSIS